MLHHPHPRTRHLSHFSLQLCRTWVRMNSQKRSHLILWPASENHSAYTLPSSFLSPETGSPWAASGRRECPHRWELPSMWQAWCRMTWRLNQPAAPSVLWSLWTGTCFPVAPWLWTGTSTASATPSHCTGWVKTAGTAGCEDATHLCTNAMLHSQWFTQFVSNW